MKKLQVYFNQFLRLGLLIWCSSSIFPTAEQLMLSNTVAVSPQLREYYAEAGKQHYRLQEESSFNRNSLRFVQSSKKLSVGYGVLPESGLGIPALELPEQTYQDLRKIGMFVKVFMGYLKGFDSDKGTFTPDSINILVPHVSSIVQWQSGDKLQLVPTGFLRRKPDAPVVVFLSGNQGKEHQKRISEFYNRVYKTDEDQPIEILSADDVAHMSAPYLLKDLVSAQRVELFTSQYIANIIGKELTRTPDLPIPVKCTLEFLQFVIQGKDCINRYDTVSRLQQDYREKEEKELEALPAKEQADLFNQFVKKHKQSLIKAAFKRLTAEQNDACDEKFKQWKTYLHCCLVPESECATSEQAKEFWDLIQKLQGELMCSNPDSQSSYSCQINGVTRIYKACYPSSNCQSHTEQLLIGFFQAHTQSLLGNLVDQKRKKSATSPSHLGFIVDSFSWLDVCDSCNDFLHTNPIWGSVLKNAMGAVTNVGFTAPFTEIHGLFRFVSQDCYGLDVPIDLRNAGGGSDYRRLGWDFRVLSEKRVCLLTRSDQKETLTRDLVIEGIQNRLIEATAMHDLEFFVSNSQLLYILKLNNRPFAINALRALQAQHPENNALRLFLAFKAKEDPRCYDLLKDKLLTFPESMAEQPNNSDFLEEKVRQAPLQYARVLFGYGCVAKIKMMKSRNNPIDVFVIDFAKHSIVYGSQGVLPLENQELSLERAKQKIKDHWKNEWKDGGKNVGFNFSNYEAEDKAITEKMIESIKEME